jgi:hypothetical protein
LARPTRNLPLPNRWINRAHFFRRSGFEHEALPLAHYAHGFEENTINESMDALGAWMAGSSPAMPLERFDRSLGSRFGIA